MLLLQGMLDPAVCAKEVVLSKNKINQHQHDYSDGKNTDQQS